MNIVINGTDKSALTTKYGCYEVPRKIYGPNGGTAKNGDQIVDYITTKYDIVFEIRPVKSDDLSWFTSLCENATVSVTYFSQLRNNTFTGTYIPELSQAQPALVNGSKTYLYPVVLTLREK